MQHTNSQDDASSIDSIVAAVYDAISFEPGGEPDWGRLESLFHSQGRLIPPAGPEGDRTPVMDLAAFAEGSSVQIDELGLREKGFRERELGRRSERFGRVAHAMSAYESLYAGGGEPFSRGVNSIQLLHEEGRWCILAIAWDVETPERAIPEDYLHLPGGSEQ